MPRLKLLEYAPYILGKSYFEPGCKVKRIDEEMLQKFVQLLEGDSVAKQIFDMCDVAQEFFDYTVDFKHWIPKELRSEIFYAAKNKSYSVLVPSQCVYLLKKAWEQAKGIPNLIIKQLPEQALTTYCTEGYFLGSATLYDVICNTCCESYSPLSETKPRNKVGNFTEVYVPDTDMVAALPNDIADSLSDSAILSITVTPNGLAVGDRLLRTMCGHFGITNSVYDLREVI